MSNGFWQLPLAPESKKCAAFTVQNHVNSNGLKRLKVYIVPYQRLMEVTVKGLHNIIVYIDDLLVHNSDHVQHRLSLQTLFNRL